MDTSSGRHAGSSTFVSLTVALVLVAAACNRSPAAPSGPRELSAFTPYLTTSLTPAGARTQFGAPDEETGSGLRIYVYKLTANRRLMLGFPGDQPILYARVINADGSVTELALR